MRALIPTIAATMMLAACAADSITGMRTANVLEAGTVRVTLEVTPDTVDNAGTVTAALKYENTTRVPVVLTSSYGCLSFAAIYRDSTRIPFPSTEYACTTAITNRTIEPDEPIIMTWPLVIGGDRGVDVPAGTYRFVAYLNTHADSLDATFVVR